MNCRTCRIEIEELELGESPGREASEHLESCAPCRSFHEERISLRRLVGGLGSVSAPADFDFRLRARLSAVGNGSKGGFSFRSLISSAPALAVAASFALLVAGVVIYRQLKPAESPLGTAAAVTKENSLGRGVFSSVATTSDASVSTSAPVAAPPEVLIARSHKVPATAQEGKGGAPVRVKRGTGYTRDGGSFEISVRPAERITQEGGTPLVATTGQPVRLHVRSASQPVRVLVDDRGGSKRTVTLEPVVIGSQDFIGRIAPQQIGPQGVW